MRYIDVVEGIDFSLTSLEAEKLRIAAEKLRRQILPSFKIFIERNGAFCLSNIVGTIDLERGLAIRVTPKIEGDDDWETAVISLLTGKENILVGGDRKAGLSRVHNNLLEALASIYLDRLERAYRQDGPIHVMERITAELPFLHGKLNITKWARSAVWRPHIFPVSRTELALENPFTQILVHVADKLSLISVNQKIKTNLRKISRDLSSVSPKTLVRQVGAPIQSLPEQWSAYKPAWSLATAILTKTSLFGQTGSHEGIGLAIEAWPLLETLLEKTLIAIKIAGARLGRNFSYSCQGSVSMLVPINASQKQGFSAKPDARLFENGTLIASFEAKYSRFDGVIPKREHTYQALSTAAALGSPIVVLIYPNTFQSQTWNVGGFNGTPFHLIAVGLDLFKTSTIDSRGEMLLNVIDKVRSSTASIHLLKGAA